MTNYVYVKSEPGLWTVGFYDPDGEWHSHMDTDDRDEAAGEVAKLNGSGDMAKVIELLGKIAEFAERTANNVIDVETAVEAFVQATNPTWNASREKPFDKLLTLSRESGLS